MVSLLVLALISAAPADNKEPVKLASPGFNAVNLPENLATFYADHFAQQLTTQGIRVLTASEIGALIGFERQKELLGCSDEKSASCIAELANALGVDGLIIGSIAKFDQTYQVNVKVVGTEDARTLALFSAQVDGDKALLSRLNEGARQVAPQVNGELGRDSVPIAATEVTATPETGRSWPIVPTVIGGGMIAVGGVLLYQSFAEVDRIKQSDESLDAMRTRTNTASAFRVVGPSAIALGVGALIYAGVAYSQSGEGTQVAIVPTSNGAAVGIFGVLP